MTTKTQPFQCEIAFIHSHKFIKRIVQARLTKHKSMNLQNMMKIYCKNFLSFICMKPAIIFLLFICITTYSCQSQSKSNKFAMNSSAEKFLKILSEEQKAKAQFTFDDEERYHWHFVPMARKGISFKDLNTQQRNVAWDLLQSGLSASGFTKTRSIMQLETVLKKLENREDSDNYRDPEKYYFSIFGNPGIDSVWGWRLEGHHVSFNFSSDTKQIISGTPGFLGSNPAIVLSGAEKGKQILKEEETLGFALLHSLSKEQTIKAIITTDAPADIITGSSRKASINDIAGISYNELNNAQQKLFMQLLHVYIDRYTAKYAASLMHDIKTAGINNLRFVWAGAEQPGVGHPHYYRIQGPTIIIEYDNTQNKANHAHTVVRDLKKDFGGDELLEHYKKHKH